MRLVCGMKWKHLGIVIFWGVRRKCDILVCVCVRKVSILWCEETEIFWALVGKCDILVCGGKRCREVN